jgi:hypothetical protein
VYVVYDDTFTPLYVTNDPIEFSEDQPNRQALVVVDDDNIAGVYCLTQRNADYAYTYNTITNHDGSTHQEITNPKLSDLFISRIIPAIGEIPAKIVLNPIYKEQETINEKLTKERLSFVKKYADVYDFEPEIQSKIDNFVQSCDVYLEALSTAYPWRYVTMNKNEVPKIPASLILLFKTLPEIE